MLLRFRVANVRSLRDEQELSFVAPGGGRDASANPVDLAGGGSLSVLPLIGVFGANASGKSNVLTAMTDMRNAVLNSYAHWASYDGIPRQVFSTPKVVLPHQVLGRYKTARKNAERMNGQHAAHVGKWDRDPYTDVHEFVEKALHIDSC